MKRKEPKRDPWLDNVKGLLIILVILGHLDSPIADTSKELKIFYLLLNSLEMPCFLIISGFLAKRRIDQRDYRSILYKLVIPYFLIDLVFWAFACMFPHGLEVVPYLTTMEPKPLVPKFHLWYLYAVMAYSFLTPALVKLFDGWKRWILFLISFACALLIGYSVEIQALKVTKVMAYYPFFLVGYCFPKKWLHVFRDRLICKLAAIPLVAFWIYFFIQYRKSIYVQVFFLVLPYSKYLEEYQRIMDPVWQRCIFLIGAVLISLAFMSLVTKHWTPFAWLGKKSLYVYVLHGFFILAIRAVNKGIYPVYEWFDTGRKLWYLQLGGIALAFLLASPPVTWLFRPLLEPDIASLLRKKEPPEISDRS